MHFASFSDFLAMGGYAFYVWLSFGLTLLCLVGIVISTRMKTRSLLGELRSKQAREARRKAAQQMENTLSTRDARNASPSSWRSVPGLPR